MKKLAALALCGILTANLAFAAGDTVQGAVKEKKKISLKGYFDKAGHKLKVGATNVLRSGTEFYVQPMKAKKATGKNCSLFWPGIGEAFGMFLTRLISGALDACTSPVPFPNGWQPLLDE